MPRELTNTASITWDGSTPSLAKANVNPTWIWPNGKPLPFGSSIVYAGDSITALALDVGLASQAGFATWAQTFSRNIAHAGVYANAGISGNTSAQLWARYGTDVLARNPKLVCILIGTNDVLGVAGGGATAAISLFSSNLQSMIAANRSIGALTILLKVIPAGTTGVPMTADQLATWVGINTFIASQAASDVTVLNAEPLIGTRDANHTVVTGCYKADAVHPNVKGAFLIGGMVAKAIKTLVADGDVFSLQPNDNLSFNMSGNGPTLADGWAAVGLPGSIAQTYSVAPRMDGGGQTQTVNFTGTGCVFGDRGGIYTNKNLTGLLNVGDIMTVFVEVSVTSLAGCGSIGFDVIDLVSGEEVTMTSILAGVSDIPAVPWSGVLASRPKVLLNNWGSTNVASVIYVGVNTALLGALNIGRIALVKGLT